MYVVPGLWAVMALFVLVLFLFSLFAYRNNWYHWEKCTPLALAGSFASSPKVLMIYRILIALYCFSILMWLVARPRGQFAYYFYTIWNFTMLTLYFGMAASQSVAASQKAFNLSSSYAVSFFDRLTMILFEVCMTMVFLVDVVLWTVLYPQAKHQMEHSDDDDACCEKFLNFDSYNVHGFNLIFMLGELSLNRIPIVWSHSIFVMLWLLMYGIYSWFVFEYGDKWVYFFLDTSKKAAPAWYTGMFALHLIFFYLVFGLNKLKRRCFGNRYDDEEEEDAADAYLLSTNSSMA
eukprot:TRINITY_DN3536_c0_g1_i1.p2 TRINITY_DN3536_c0_g1~~TRINITY_DN3536_c0_g1_i1.p2  ORF type:complete len:291 (+),score=42.37 TRINITY_DN3536_c0_g1_i1:1299-2171(+)